MKESDVLSFAEAFTASVHNVKSQYRVGDKVRVWVDSYVIGDRSNDPAEDGSSDVNSIAKLPKNRGIWRDAVVVGVNPHNMAVKLVKGGWTISFVWQDVPTKVVKRGGNK